MTDVQATGAPALRSSTGLGTDLDAVTAGLTLPHNSGPVEGTVNKIKMIKRQMYGRANLDLLRIHVLHAVNLYETAASRNVRQNQDSRAADKTAV